MDEGRRIGPGTSRLYPGTRRPRRWRRTLRPESLRADLAARAAPGVRGEAAALAPEGRTAPSTSARRSEKDGMVELMGKNQLSPKPDLEKSVVSPRSVVSQ